LGTRGNILAGREVVTEFLQDDAEPLAVADGMLSILNSPEAREKQVADFRDVIQGLGAGGASLRAAQAILGI